jgi:hypothetical protein
MREPVIVAKPCPRCDAEFLTRAVWRSGRIWYERLACPDCHTVTRAKLDAWLAELRAETLRRREGRTCRGCGVALSLDLVMGTLYCSRLCAARTRRVEHPATPPPLVTKACETCGKDFQTSRLARQRFCTMLCQERDAKRRSNAKLKARNRERLGNDKSCDMCGRTFAPKTRRHRWCSYRCRIQAYEPKTGVLIEPRAWRKW